MVTLPKLKTLMILWWALIVMFSFYFSLFGIGPANSDILGGHLPAFWVRHDCYRAQRQLWLRMPIYTVYPATVRAMRYTCRPERAIDALAPFFNRFLLPSCRSKVMLKNAFTIPPSVR
jgi:hypothetical protein